MVESGVQGETLTLRNCLGLGWVRIFKINKIVFNVIYYSVLTCHMSLFSSNSSTSVNIHEGLCYNVWEKMMANSMDKKGEMMNIDTQI